VALLETVIEEVVSLSKSTVEALLDVVAVELLVLDVTAVELWVTATKVTTVDLLDGPDTAEIGWTVSFEVDNEDEEETLDVILCSVSLLRYWPQNTYISETSGMLDDAEDKAVPDETFVVVTPEALSEGEVASELAIEVEKVTTEISS
jgi:hypothetical protein